MFLADFIKNYKQDCEVSFIKLASYQGTSSTRRGANFNRDAKS